MNMLIATGPCWPDAYNDRGLTLRLAAAMILYRTRIGYTDTAKCNTLLMLQCKRADVSIDLTGVPQVSSRYNSAECDRGHDLKDYLDDCKEVCQETRPHKPDVCWVLCNRGHFNEGWYHAPHQIIVAEEVLLGHDVSGWKEKIDATR